MFAIIENLSIRSTHKFEIGWAVITIHVQENMAKIQNIPITYGCLGSITLRILFYLLFFFFLIKSLFWIFISWRLFFLLFLKYISTNAEYWKKKIIICFNVFQASFCCMYLRVVKLHFIFNFFFISLNYNFRFHYSCTDA